MNRDWIVAEFSKGIEAELGQAATAKARAEAPPDPALSLLYNEIAEADERHGKAVETIAIRYGYTPNRTLSGGLGESLGRLRDKVANSVLGNSPLERVGQDLAAKANAIHWYVAWMHAFEAIGESQTARELSTILTEEQSLHDALQEGLTLLVEKGARGELNGAERTAVV